MSLTNFPTSLDTWTGKTDNVDNVMASHVNKLQDSVAAIEGKVGVDDSAVTTSLDYKISDNIRQVNLLTNSGFGVWSNSTLENVGTQITLTDVTNGICLTANTQDLVVGKLFKFDSGDFSGNVYEVAAVTEDVSFTVHDTSITDTGTPGTGYEVTPGCVAADSKGMDGWRKDTTLDIYREYSGINTKDGSFYSLKMEPSTTDDYTRWPIDSIYSKEIFYKQFEGRTVSFGAWVKTSTASHIRLQLSDGVSNTFSSYHTGGGNWEWLEVTAIMSTSMSYFLCWFAISQSSGIVYISQPMLVFGSSIGEGNYVAPQGEVIWLEAPMALTDYSGTQTVSANTPINLEVQSNGKIPKNIKALNIDFRGICSSTEKFLALSFSGAYAGISLYNQVANIINSGAGWISCDSDGNIIITRDATFTNVKINTTGVQL